MLHKLLAGIAMYLLLAELAFPFGRIVYDPTNYVQNAMTAVRMAESLTNEARMIANQVQQYQDMLKQGAQLSSGQWDDIQGLLTQLGTVMNEGNALAYDMQNLDQAFQASYPGYQAPTDWASDYEAWTKQGLDTFRGVLNGVGLQSQQMASEQDRLRAIQSLSDGAVGRMQAVQAGNMLAHEQVQQTAKLRQLVMMQTNAQGVYYAHQLNKDAAQEAKVQQWLQAPRKKVPEYGSSGVGKMPVINP